MNLPFLRRCAESPRLPWLLALLAIVFTIPSLRCGYYQDDHLIRLRFQGFPNLPGVHGKLLDTCVFGDGDPQQTRARMELGFFPWWTPDDWKIAFWRPLTSLTHYADWVLFGDRAWVMHLHNMLWYGALVFALTVLYRRFLTPPWVAGLAALLYLLDAAHAFPVGWIATRNAALSSVFIVLILYFHDRWRRDGWRAGAPAALAALAVGLLASEATVASGAYLAAYALFVDRARWHARFAALLPYLAIVIVWRIAYERMGYGVAGSMLYTDPLQQPLQLAWDMVRYMPVLLFCQLAASDPVISCFLPGALAAGYLVVAVAFLAWTAWVLWPVLKREPTARFWALGMVLSALPVCTTIPQGRELMNPGIGAMALVAQFLAWHFSKEDAASQTKRFRKAAGAMAVTWIVLHIAVSSVSLPINSYTAPVKAEQVAARLNSSLPSDPDIRNATLVIVDTPADLLAATLPIMRVVVGEPVPKHTRLLCAGVRDLEVTRVDERTLKCRLDDGFLTRPWTQIFRNPATRPMHAGQTVALTGFAAEVISVTPDGRPSEVAFHFDVALEDASLRWVVFHDQRYVPFTPPAVGQTVHVTGPGFTEIVRWFLSG